MTYFFELQYWCNQYAEFIQTTGTIKRATNWQEAKSIVDAVAYKLIEKHPEMQLEYQGAVIRPLLSAVPRTTH